MAKAGEFLETEQETVLALSNGYIEVRKRGSNDLSVAKFDTIVQRFGWGGTNLPVRNWTGMFELNTFDFLGRLAELERNPEMRTHWFSEAFKRLGVPALAISHTLLGLGLAMMRRGSPRSDQLPYAYYFVLALTHILFIATAEGVIRMNLQMGWILAAIVPLEAVIGTVLIAWNSGVLGGRHPRSTALPLAICDTISRS